MRTSELRMGATVSALSFLLGRLMSTAWKMSFQGHHVLPTPDSNPLEQQIRDHELFQEMLHASQHPVDCISARFVILDEMFPKDGFASEFQYVARLLQASLSSRRVLWIKNSWKSAYCPNEDGGGWTCLWQSTTNCSSLPPKGNKPNMTSLDSLTNPLTYAIESRRSESPFFDPYVYGPRKFVDAPISFPLKRTSSVVDIIPHWERAYGRYWIRSQLSHYLWRPSDNLKHEINQRLPILPPTPFIGMHIRFTDNIPDFERSFARNAAYTRHLSRYLKVAEQIRDQQQQNNQRQLPTTTIFIATDHSDVLAWAAKLFRGWTVIGQANVQRSTSQQRIWFANGRSTAAGAMATDLEVLRRADYLIGSFQSNVYRLAAQLNTAFHVHNYSVHSVRHFTVDVEWYEDP